jgi:hypothetical protein
LVVQLRRAAFVLPWFRFLYAAGDNTRLELVFASHTVTIAGHGLVALLTAAAGQRVIRLTEPSDNEAKFGVRGPSAEAYRGPAISSITVTKFE